MAPKSQQAARGRKKVKKVVTEGIAHVHASFNNTIITITMPSPPPPPALRVSRAPARALPLPLRWLPNTQARLPRTTV